MKSGRWKSALSRLFWLNECQITLSPWEHIYIAMRDYCLESEKILSLISLMHRNLFTSKIDCQYPINTVSTKGTFIWVHKTVKTNSLEIFPSGQNSNKGLPSQSFYPYLDFGEKQMTLICFGKNPSTGDSLRAVLFSQILRPDRKYRCCDSDEICLFS